jgi:hypothetical protein
VWRKLLIYGGIAFAVFFIYSSPDGAAGAVQGTLNSLANVGDQFAQFLQTLLT